jgi:hypothetical protein
MATGQGTATIDFGPHPGVNQAFVLVTGQTAISEISSVEAYVMGSDFSVDHDANDHRWFAELAGLSCDTPTIGDGFAIYATSQQKLTGQFTVRWVWADTV